MFCFCFCFFESSSRSTRSTLVGVPREQSTYPNRGPLRWGRGWYEEGQRSEGEIKNNRYLSTRKESKCWSLLSRVGIGTRVPFSHPNLCLRLRFDEPNVMVILYRGPQSQRKTLRLSDFPTQLHLPPWGRKESVWVRLIVCSVLPPSVRRRK